MTLIFKMLLDVVKLHIRAKFHQAKCSDLLDVIVITVKQKKTLR